MSILAREELKIIDALEADVTLYECLEGYPEGLLPPQALEQVMTFVSEARRKSWLLGRNAVSKVIERLSLMEDPFKIRFPHPRLSLTHSENRAVAAGLKTENPSILGIGVDLELRDSIRPDSARFFMRPDELQELKNLSSSLLQETLLRIWTIKEALFKADPMNAGRGIRDYRIGDLGTFSGLASYVVGDEFKKFRYITLPKDRGYLSVALSYT